MIGASYISDMRRALSMQALVWHRSVSEVKARYKRTLIGPFWTSLSMAIFVVSFGLIGSRLWGNEVAHYMPFFCAGYLTWILISTIIGESKAIFTQNREILLSTPVPMHVFVFELVIRNYVVFLHHLVVYVLVLAFFSYNPGWGVLLMIPGAMIIFVASVAFSMIWGIACTRYQDLGQLSQSILQIIFFVTPIMWPIDRLTGTAAQWLVDYNPMYHFVEMMRAPMLGKVPSTYSYIFTLTCCVVLILFAMHLFRRFRHRIVFWI
jgi:ABC-type polysaccharide/polyol phosphate export permease